MPAAEEQGFDVALRRIKAHTGRNLDLSDLDLDILPEELWGLSNLANLGLRNNRLAELPPQFGQLRNLTHLWLDNNQLTQLPRQLGQLTNLTHLGLDNNQLTELPPQFGQLRNLTHLWLDNNQLTQLPRQLGQLTNLRKLWLDNNQLTQLPSQFDQLRNLAQLTVSANDFGENGIHKVLDMLSNAESGIKTLDLNTNPGLELLDIPELTDGTDAQAILAIYRKLFSERSLRKVRFAEAKLIVLGTEAVGKTSLVRALTTGKACEPNEPKTPGAAHKIFVTSWPEGSTTEEPIQLNIWDFGGQEMLLQTHRYFLSKRSIYLIVHDRREEDAKQLFAWIDTVTARAPDSPMIVAINKCDDGRHSLAIDLQELEDDTPNLVEHQVVHCLDQNDTGYMPTEAEGPNQRIDRLRDLIVAEVRVMQSTNRLVPPGWVRVRTELRSAAQKQKIVTPTDFIRICLNADEKDDQVVAPHEQRGLLRILHETGVVVAHGLTDETRDFQGLALLDPNWLTTAIYALLADSEVRDHGGVFDKNLLQRALERRGEPSTAYDEAGLDYVISLMTQEKFGLAMPLNPLAKPPTFLLPEALSTKVPTTAAGWENQCLRFRYRYKNLPSGLVPQFIARSFVHADDNSDRWRTGCTLMIDGCPALVSSNIKDDYIEIKIAGPHEKRQGALTVIRTLLDKLNAANPEAAARARVPLPDQPDLDVGFEYLVEQRKLHGAQRLLPVEGASRDYTVGELLGESEALTEGRSNPTHPISEVQFNTARTQNYTEQVKLIAAVVGLVAAMVVGYLTILSKDEPSDPAGPEVSTLATDN